MSDKLVIANSEKAERAAELVIADNEKADRVAELVIADAEKADRAAELVIANKEKAERAAELVIANIEKEKRAAELVIANVEKAKRAAVLVIANEEKAERADELFIAKEQKAELVAELVIANEEKADRAAELVIANEEKAERADELFIAKEQKAELVAELVIANEDKVERETELVIANNEKEKRAAELVIANAEKAKRSAELVIANEEKEKRAAELVIANKEKEKRAAELVIANAEKAKRSAELVIANAEKAKRSAELVIANLEKENRADELLLANKELTYQNEEKVKRAAELVIAEVNKTKREAELVIAKIEKAKRIAKSIIADKELSFQTEEKSKRVAELVIADAEKERRAAELVIANIKKAKRSAELVIANVEKAKRSAEFVISNKEIVYQKSEKLKREAELVIANIEKTKRAAELVIANIEKSKRAAEFVFMNKELILAKEKEKHVVELTIVNKELSQQIEKRKETELALKESNEKYLRAFQSSPYLITITRLEDGKIIEVNDTFVLLSGFTRKEALSNSTIGLDMWKNIEERNSTISALLAGKVVAGKEFAFRKKNGEIRTGLFSAKIIYINKEPNIISSIDDITERKQAENLLKESEQKSMSIMENSADAIFITNQQGKYMYTNKAVSNMLGYTSEEMKSKTFADISPTNRIEEYFKFFEQILKEGKGFTEIELIKKGGDYISTDLNAVVLPDGTIYGSCRDITERKLAELIIIKAKEKAEENEERFRNLFESSPIGKSMTGIDGSLHVNKSFCEIVGYSEEELRGKKMADITHPEDLQLTNEKLQYLLNGGAEKVLFEKRYIHKNGNIVWVDVSTYLQRDKEYKPQFFITTIIDTTSRKNFENELIKAKEKAEESDRLKSAFLTNMSHEIRTPMNGILGFAELLKEPNLTSDDQQDFIQTMQISGERLLNTINSIVDISKIESGLMGINIEETNLNEKIEFTYKFFKPEAENKKLQLLYKNGLPTNEAIIKTDNEKVYGILTNLVRNAIKFTFDGSIEFGFEKKGEYLEFFVKDTGIGIPQKQQQLIFERFRQGSESHNRGYEGSGLGLSISKSYVEMLGGRIWVESKEGLGSTFYFTIPYISVSEEKTTIENVVSSEHKGVQLKNLKILIVEDDEISYSLLSRTLHKISKEVLHAITGVQAVEACRNNPDLDLVLMDIRMPQMSGLEATQQIRQFNNDVIIIAQTAYAFTGDSEKAIEAGCNDYITKPINMTILFELIKKHVNK